ncbi:hypothetical protein [Brevibacillus agri]|nr:hypothetical protein PMI08_02976 [Brevibacillus sp. CF112]
MEPVKETKPSSPPATEHESKDLPEAWKRFLQAVQSQFSAQKPPSAK